MLLLLKDHTVKRVDNEKIMSADIEKSRYILVDTSVNVSKLSKNFVLVDPSKIPQFTDALIRYQMIFMYDDNDEGITNAEPIPPVEVNTKSLADVINLLNCINRIDIPNEMISNDVYLFVNIYVIIGYFEVYLYHGKKKVYHKLYQNTEIDDDKKLQNYYGERILNSLKVAKKFHKIYNTDVIHEMCSKNEFLYIYKDMTWNIRTITNDKDYSLIGVPLLGSRTMTFLTDIEFVRIMSIKKIGVTYTILFIINEDQQNHISEYIAKGLYDEIGEANHDYIIISNLDYGLNNPMQYRFIMLDILSHIAFSLRFTNMIYRYVEGFEDQMIDDGDGVDSIVSINLYSLYKKKKGDTRTLFMNEDTIIPLDKLLELI